MLAREPVPVLVSYLGYPCTTGVEAIDYRVVDAITDPVEEAPHPHPLSPTRGEGCEQLIRLDPCFCCYAPPPDSPPPAVLPPIKRNGFVTFGAPHKLDKLNY